MSIDTGRLVLSEVHVGSSALGEEEVVSRYAYLTPPPLRRNTAGTPTAATAVGAGSTADDGSNSGNDNSSSSGAESEEGTYSRVTRRRKRLRTASQRRRPAHEVLTVVHRMATTLGLVGQQVWSAAFLLGDFVLTHEHIFAGMQVVELGAGPGVVGLVAARVAQRCYLTDYHQEVLKLLARNAEANSHLFASGRSPTRARAAADVANSKGDGERDSTADGDTSCGVGEGGCVVAVRELDWFTFSREEGSAVAAVRDSSEDMSQGEDGLSEEEDQDCEGTGSGERKGSGSGGGGGGGICRPFSWRRDELEGLSPSVSASPGAGLVLVAADVIYDESLTDAFFHALRLLMPIPVPPVPAGRGGRDELAGDVTINSSPRDAKRDSLLDQTPSVQHASVDSAGFAVSPRDRGSTNDESGDFPVAEGNAQAVLYLALEKRFNFSMAELSVAATGYSALLRNVVDTTYIGSGDARVDGSAPQGDTAKKDFEGRRLPLSFQQCFRYQRSDAMELWEIRRRTPATLLKT